MTEGGILVKKICDFGFLGEWEGKIVKFLRNFKNFRIFFKNCLCISLFDYIE